MEKFDVIIAKWIDLASSGAFEIPIEADEEEIGSVIDAYDEAKEEVKEAAKTVLKANMPVFEGSEKQIAWAKDIYNRAIDEMVETAVSMAGRSSTKDYVQQELAALPVSLEEAIAARTSAKWWIEKREGLTSEFFNFMSRIAGKWD